MTIPTWLYTIGTRDMGDDFISKGQVGFVNKMTSLVKRESIRCRYYYHNLLG